MDIGEKELYILDNDNKETDVYFTKGGSYSLQQFTGGSIGIRYRKPVITIGELMNSDMSACLRSRGLEGYAPADYDEFSKVVSLLRARKVFQDTNMLIITDRGGKIGRPVMSNIWDFEDLKSRFGIKTRIITYKELGDELEKVKQSNNSDIRDFTNNLINNAQGIHIDEKYVHKNVEFTFAIKNLMNKYNCNTHTIECFEFCSSKLSNNWQVVPCLTHTLLKDEGYPSGCEGDINALLAMDILMGLSRKSSYMGNLAYGNKRRVGVEEDFISFGHNVPGRKMCGFDTPDLPYQLRNFVQSGWGVKVEIDLGNLDEKTITIARFNPSANKLLVAKGEIVKFEGIGGEIGCKQKYILKIPNARKLAENRANYGFHFASALGDYTDELKKLGKMLNIEIDLHNA